MSQHTDDQVVDFFDQLKTKHSQAFSEQVPEPIEKQIIALAHREMDSPLNANQLNAKTAEKKFNRYWWKRLQLPLYMAATICFCVISLPLFFSNEDLGFEQNHLKVPPGTQVKELQPSLNVSTQENHKRSANDKPSNTLPSNTSSSNTLTDTATESQSALSQQSLKQHSLNKQPLSPASQSFKKVQPLAPDIWIDKIRKMQQKGDKVQVNKEIANFNKIYPNYPVEWDFSS